MAHTSSAVAILYQAAKPPVRNGLAKPMKPGGYSDSGADIAFCLRQSGTPVITPTPDPDPASHLDWVFPDDQAGIAQAIASGARVLWANTSLFSGHPIESFHVPIVGQNPSDMERYDDKFSTNQLLQRHHLPVARSCLLGTAPESCDLPLDNVSTATLADFGLKLPLMLKPVRGRGSQGVVLVHTLEELRQTAHRLFSATEIINGSHFPLYGSPLILEQYLPGEEITLTIMPSGAYALPSGPKRFDSPWFLPPVRRVNHANGVIPYNGVVPVTQNSSALTPAEIRDPAIQAVTEACIAAARLIAPRAPIRIDCRRASDASDAPYLLFDLNMKPNLTGAGRPGRDTQDCLSAISARALGWTYTDLLRNMLAQARE